MHIERLIALCREHGLDTLADEGETARYPADWIEYATQTLRDLDVPAEYIARATEDL